MHRVGCGWLASNFPPAILASGDAGEIGTYHLVLYVPPEVDRSPFGQIGSWLEVVGHYDDPVSATCRYRPLTNFPNPLVSLEGAQATCGERFVVESVIEVDGP